ncbi:hypothetical protein NBRC116591_01870 [Sessilibacter corallicola]|uniref:Uncharacterized protein n=1 Tax=Sessilibacter corallicola TaxID=2904075 RepID=A0ABQ0A402_9GAMM
MHFGQPPKIRVSLTDETQPHNDIEQDKDDYATLPMYSRQDNYVGRSNRVTFKLPKSAIGKLKSETIPCCGRTQHYYCARAARG